MNESIVLPDRQKEAYDAFVRMVHEPGRESWPTVRDLQAAMGLSSNSEAARYLNILTGLDLLTHEYGQPYKLPGFRFELVRDEVSE